MLDDRPYVYQASSDVNGGTVTIGYPYSLLEWCAEPHSSWSLPVDVRRVPSTQTAQEVGAAQIKALANARAACLEALDIIAADGKYGNAGFLRSVKRLRCGILARLRCDRVLCGSAPPPTGKKGRPRVHGARFAFKEPETWSTPDELIELEDPCWGQVRLERWNSLHEKKGADVPYAVIRANVHLERSQPPAALWLAWLSPNPLPGSITVTLEMIWSGFSRASIPFLRRSALRPSLQNSAEKRRDGRQAGKERRNNAMLWSKRLLQRLKRLDTRLVRS